MEISIVELIYYTDEERARWERWFQDNGDELLSLPIGGDHLTTVGELVMHTFGTELRHVQRVRGDAFTDWRSFPCSTVGEVFGFGLRSRSALRSLVSSSSTADWARRIEFDGQSQHYRVSVRKLLFHILIHEIRHWAQVGRIMRERGLAPPGNHDLLASSALD
jgi:DinB superfamily